jgi:recA bacterial DNA recombination protein
MATAHAIRVQIEATLAQRVPAALTLKIKQAPELFATGMVEVDEMLGGGIPRGSITEVSGAASTGKTSFALSAIASITQLGNACAWVDVNDALSPEATFLDELDRRPFLLESLNKFRTYPFLKLDSDRVVMLDVQFVVELLTTGVYWSIHDALPREKRGRFKELWGRMFELYTVNLLAQFYPPMSGMLAADVAYRDGQIDALLDFGSHILVFEIKSSLLTEPAKRSADRNSFSADFRRKFVENENGKPKAIKQLANVCRAILEGTIKTANTGTPAAIYPIFVSDEPAIEATFMNAFFNEEFQKEGITDARVKPLTVMTIDELEQALCYVTDNDFSWSELLESRFNEFGVYPNSVGQAIYALMVMRGLKSKQNSALKRKYDEIADRIREIYQNPPRP